MGSVHPKKSPPKGRTWHIGRDKQNPVWQDKIKKLQLQETIRGQIM